jgi:transposase
MDILSVANERVDDLPVLMKQMERMGVADALDRAFPTHANWQGPSLGSIGVIWLVHILSEANHRLNHVQPWVESHKETLSALAGYRVRSLDFADDRLTAVLRYLNDDMDWKGFEGDLNGRLVRVYDLAPRPLKESPSAAALTATPLTQTPLIRVDATTGIHHGPVTEDGLFQYGHSKDRRPDLGQVKIMVATLDPLGLLLATHVVSGEHADDPLYVPVIRSVQRTFRRGGLLFVGDCKMAALATRAYLVRTGDAYLCPLSEKQWTKEHQRRDLDGVWNGSVVLTPIERTGSDGVCGLMAEGFEIEEVVTATLPDEWFSDRSWTGTWTERRVIVRSLAHAASEEAALRGRLKKAEAEIAALSERKQGKPSLTHSDELLTAARSIAARHRVADLLQITVEARTTQRSIRAYGESPARIETETTGRLTARVDPPLLEDAIRRLGWRAFATIEPKERLSLEGVVLAYRDEYLIERSFGRLKGKPLSLTPMYLARDDHATGLIRLLSIALRVLTLLEFVVRRSLAQENTAMEGLYAGQKTRKTARPTAEKLLKAFDGITLTCIQHADGTSSHLTPLSDLQTRILVALDFPHDLFSVPRPPNPSKTSLLDAPLLGEVRTHSPPPSPNAASPFSFSSLQMAEP